MDGYFVVARWGPGLCLAVLLYLKCCDVSSRGLGLIVVDGEIAQIKDESSFFLRLLSPGILLCLDCELPCGLPEAPTAIAAGTTQCTCWTENSLQLTCIRSVVCL